MPNHHAVDTTASPATQLHHVADAIRLYGELLDPGVSGEARTLSFTACTTLAADLRRAEQRLRRITESL